VIYKCIFTPYQACLLGGKHFVSVCFSSVYFHIKSDRVPLADRLLYSRLSAVSSIAAKYCGFTTLLSSPGISKRFLLILPTPWSQPRLWSPGNCLWLHPSHLASVLVRGFKELFFNGGAFTRYNSRPPHQSSEPSPTGAESLRAAVDQSICEEEPRVPEIDCSGRSQLFDVDMPAVGSDSVSLPAYAGTSQAVIGSAAEIHEVEGPCQEAQM